MRSLPVLLITIISGALLHAADFRVSVGDVEDRRTTGEHFNGLDVKLKLSGDDLAKVKCVKIDIAKAIDDTGRDLLKSDEPRSRNEYTALRSDNPSRTTLNIDLKNPARKAATVAEISGTVHLIMPAADPESVITLENFAALSAKPIENAGLKKTEVEMRLFSKEDAQKIAG